MAGITTAALVIVDLQEDFCPPHGSLAITDGRAIAELINTLLSLPFALKLATRDFHPADHISFATQHQDAQPFTSTHTIVNPKNEEETQRTTLWPPHCVQGTKGCELIPELDQSQIDFVLDKGQDKRLESYSAFGPPFRAPRISMTGLDERLKDAGITHLFVVGLAFDCCVKYTAIDAADLGFTTYVIEDGTKAADRSQGGLSASRREMQQRGVKVISSESDELKLVMSVHAS